MGPNRKPSIALYTLQPPVKGTLAPAEAITVRASVHLDSSDFTEGVLKMARVHLMGGSLTLNPKP